MNAVTIKIPTQRQFAAWLRKQPKNAAYIQAEPGACLVASALRAVNPGVNVRVGSTDCGPGGPAYTTSLPLWLRKVVSLFDDLESRDFTIDDKRTIRRVLAKATKRRFR